jgi:hypothetical protein
VVDTATPPTTSANSERNCLTKPSIQTGELTVTIISDDNATVDPGEFDRDVCRTVLAMRRSLGVTVAELAAASGLPHADIEAIERGGTTTRAQRQDIAVAVCWLSNNAVAHRA